MISLIGASDILEKARLNFRDQRLALGLTQAGLSRRSGVALATLRKFERTGIISFLSLLQLASVLHYLDPLHKAFDPVKPKFRTIDDVIKANENEEKKKRQRGSIS